MIVVSDTTPIISLIKIDCLDILEKLYKNIIVPRAVYGELIVNADYEDEIDIINRCNFLKVQDVEENLSVLLLQKQLNLDKGESDAIVLANNINADLIVIDERKARKIDKDIGLNVTGTLGILAKAKQKGLIKELRPLLDELIDNNIRIDKKLYMEILKLVEE